MEQHHESLPRRATAQCRRAVGCLFAGLTVVGWSPPPALAVGEPDTDGFPSWAERVHHELANRARVEPQFEMNLCGSNCAEAACYSPEPPLYYNPLLGHAARFHAAHMTLNSYLDHDSSCTLVSNIPTLYPDSCDGAASCSCEGGTNICNPTCTTADQRVQMFAGSFGGEIIASGSTPVTAFYGWLYEDAGGDTQCHYTMENGHRWLLLTNTGGVGFGVDSLHVGDFGDSDPNWEYPIPSGSHWPRQDDTVELWANWYDTNGPNSALVNVAGTCHAMSLQRGTVENGASWAEVTGVGTGCYRYYFVFTDSHNNQVTFPSTGSLGIGPEGTCDDWNTDRPAMGAGCSCTPDCTGRECGDDGCGGSCGSCDSDEDCVNGQCVPAVYPDGGPGPDGAPTGDGGPDADAADLPEIQGSGCSCRTAPTSTLGWLLPVLVLLGWRRRRLRR